MDCIVVCISWQQREEGEDGGVTTDGNGEEDTKDGIKEGDTAEDNRQKREGWAGGRRGEEAGG
jgi:hypothetical protein